MGRESPGDVLRNLFESPLAVPEEVFASLTGDQMYAVTNRMNELKRELIKRLGTKAAAQGANAVIGIDFESTMPGGSAIMVSAHGTAVIVEKI